MKLAKVEPIVVHVSATLPGKNVCVFMSGFLQLLIVLLIDVVDNSDLVEQTFTTTEQQILHNQDNVGNAQNSGNEERLV